MFESAGADSFAYGKTVTNELFTTQPLTLNMRQTINDFDEDGLSYFFRKHLKHDKFEELLALFSVGTETRKDYECFLKACVNCFKCFIDNDDTNAQKFSDFYLDALNDTDILSNKTSTDDEIDFVLELDKKCPICGRPLVVLENERYARNFYITKIYRDDLEPMEAMMFDSVSPAPSNLNSIENLIAVCPEHYLDYEKTHDLDMYEKLLTVKKIALEDKKLKQKIDNIDMTESLKNIINRLFSLSDTASLVELKYSALRIDEKVPRSLAITYQSVENRVIKYYHFIDTYLRGIEIKTNGKSTTLSQQIKAISDSYVAAGLEIREILNRITYDLVNKLGGDTSITEECAIVVAYFVQHCEVLSKWDFLANL